MRSGDEAFMRLALAEARKALTGRDVPVGAVVVEDGQVLARAYNQREALQDPTAHAEILALRGAARKKGSWRLNECDLFVTLEPCAMCAGAIVASRVRRLIFGARDSKAGACGSIFDIPRDARLNHRVGVKNGVLAEDCGLILKEFFRRLRESGGEMAESG